MKNSNNSPKRATSCEWVTSENVNGVHFCGSHDINNDVAAYCDKHMELAYIADEQKESIEELMRSLKD